MPTISPNLLRGLFRRVYFVNGTAYAGKSTLVRTLAEKHKGIMCGENYHDALTNLTDPEHQPNLRYFDTMSGWHEFLSRTPEQYCAWIDGVNREAAELAPHQSDPGGSAACHLLAPHQTDPGVFNGDAAVRAEGHGFHS